MSERLSRDVFVLPILWWTLQHFTTYNFFYVSYPFSFLIYFLLSLSPVLLSGILPFLLLPYRQLGGPVHT